MSTYKDEYELWLQEQLDSGGKQAVMDAVIRDFNAIGPAFSSSNLFNQWIKVASHVCDNCKEAFVPQEVDLNHQVICTKCQE